MINSRYNKLDKSEFKIYFFKKSLWFRSVFILVGLVFAYFTLDSASKDFDTLQNESSYTTGTLTKPPQRVKSSIHNNEHTVAYMNIYLQEYPTFIFTMQEEAYEVCNSAVHEDLKTGDQVEIQLPTTELTGKLLKTTVPSFNAKHFGWKNIVIYNIKQGDQSYVDFSRYMKHYDKEDNVSWFLWLWAAIFLFGAVVLPSDVFDS